MRQEQEISRRSVLSTVAGAAVMCIGGAAKAELTGSLLGSSESRQSGGPTSTLQNLTAADFSKHLGSSFVMRSESKTTYTVGLSSVTEFSRKNDLKRPAELRAPFSLLFRGSSYDTPQQGRFRIEHDTLGTYEFFLVPMSSPGQPVILEAVFG